MLDNEFMKYLNDGDHILDAGFGCGNGNGLVEIVQQGCVMGCKVGSQVVGQKIEQF